MSDYVVDASVVVKWVVEEPLTENTIRVLNPSDRIHAPELLLIETDNYLTRQVRRGNLLVDEAAEHRRLIRSAPVKLHAYKTVEENAFQISTLTRHSIYDCVYLALAISVNGRVVTADRRFYDLSRTSFGDYLRWVGDL